MASKNVIGAKIVLEGEAAYKSALKSIKTAQAELRSEMKLSQSQFAGSANSLEALTSKQEIMSKQVAESEKKVKLYKDAMKDAVDQQENARKKLDELKSSQTATDEELRKAQSDYDKAAEKVTKYQTNLNYAETELNNMQTELDSTSKLVEEASKSMDGCATSIDEFGNEVKKSEDEVNVFGEVLKANLTAEAIISSVKAIANAIKEIATAAIETGMEFEASMDNVAALSGATGKELDSLTEKAKEMGAQTMFSASEAADAFGYMALAGWKTEDMLEGIEPVLNLAAAANMDLAEASDIVTDYLTAFGLSAEDAAEFTDQLAYAMSNSNTNVTQLGEAYKNCAASATSLGFSVEDVTAVLMTMANAGVKGGEAGTGLSSIMTRLATNTKNCNDVLAEYGVTVFDANGNINSLSSILGQLSGIWSELNDQEQASLAKTIAGQQQFSKLQTIMAGVSESAIEGGNSFFDYAEALDECDGNAKDMANTMQDNLKGKITILQSALDALKVSTYEIFDDTFKNSVDGATNAITRLNNSVSSGDLNLSFNKLANSLGDFADGAISLGEKALPVMVDGLSWIMDNSGKIALGITAIVSAQAAMSITTGIQSAIASWNAFQTATEGATVAQWLLNGAMEANPIGLLVAGITAASVALAGFTYYVTTTKADIDEETESIVRSTEAYKQLNESTESSAESRKASREEMQNEESATLGLVERLEELQNAEKLTTNQQAEMQSIIAKLNSAYPELNLAIDKNGKLIGSTTEEIKAQCTAYIQLAKVQAAQNDLAEIADELYQKEKALADISQERLELENKLYDMTGKSVDELNDYANSITDGFAAVAFYNTALGQTLTAYNDLNDVYEETENQMSGLEDEYQTASNYINENTEATDDNAEAYQNLQDAVGETSSRFSELSAEGMQSITDLAEAIEDSVSDSISAFEEFSEQEAVTKEQLIANLASQIEGVRNWSDDMQSLAKRGISEGLLEELAKLGPEGYQYVKAFLDMSDEELSDYDKTFQEYVEIPTETSSAIASVYGDVATDAMKAYNKELRRGGLEAVDAADEFSSETASTISGNINYSEGNSAAVDIIDGLIAGINGNSSRAYNAFQNFAKTLYDRFKSGYESSQGSGSSGNSGGSNSTQSMKDIAASYTSAFRDAMTDMEVARNSAPASSFTMSIDTTNTSQQSGYDEIKKLLEEWLPQMTDKNIYIDGDALVGSTVDKIDNALGNRAVKRGV